jgi:undecaprenyl diphosphate synthase
MKSPQHIALIMDGNRRWAKKHGLAIFIGHTKGEDRIEPLIDYAIQKGIKYLTFWGFSTENWQRDKKEVNFLLSLYRNNLHKKMNSFHKKKVRIKVIGNLALFPPDIQKKSQQWMELTKENNAITVNFALSYGGRDEIIRAITKWHEDQKSRPKADRPLDGKLTGEEFEKYLDTSGQPDPDLIIRTGGVQRMSGFLLWQSEYSEFYFTETLWPDFTSVEFQKALDDFDNRKRRYGR